MSQSSGVVIGLFLGIIVGIAGVYFIIAPTINDYDRIVEALDVESGKLYQVSTELSKIIEEKNDLKNELYSLRSDNAILQGNFNRLNADLDHANLNWKNLSEQILDFRQDLYSYCVLNESFARIFTTEELDKIAFKVNEITGNDDEIWDGLNSIHRYVRDEIDYAYDSSVPIIDTYRYYGDKENPLLSEFHISYIENLYQPLSFTVEYEQGDCDDQAMLEYAMIKYFQRHILEEEYRLYLVHMKWEDSAHLTVFQPVQGDNICILDPAGNYQTGVSNRLGQNPIRAELLNYQNYWYEENGEIIELSFWVVDIDSGNHSEDFSGSLEEAISFFEDTIEDFDYPWFLSANVLLHIFEENTSSNLLTFPA